jgi:vitamin B12 transporter
MKIKLFPIVTIIISCLLTPSPSPAAIPAEMEFESGPFDLYFSDEPAVEVTSRYPKALSRIAENVTVITAAEIAAANVHTLAEILNRAAGVFVSFNGQDFGSSSTIYIHGSTEDHQHHTLVLLDGIKYNYAISGTAETNGIPVSIIERVEIVKGPASSAWGSALGGVINIVTKKIGKNFRPEGDLFLSYGEAQSSDIRAETKGKAGLAGYYLYAGKQNSDGIRNHRFFDNENIYGKLNLDLPRRSELQIAGGYTQPEQKYFDWPAIGLSAIGKSRDLFSTVSLSSSLSKNLHLTLTAKTFSRKYIQNYKMLDSNNQYQDYIWREENRGVNSRLVRSGKNHTVAAGLDYNRTELDQTIVNGPFLQGSGQPAEADAVPATEEYWAIYLNDTFNRGRLTVIPGFRYDYHSISENFLSPGLGAVYQHRHDTLFRASVARGFSKPNLGNIDGGGSIFSTINADLKPEQVWSWQAGVETSALKLCRLKTTIFFHDLHDVWSRDPDNKVVNTGKNERLGYEIELETIPLHDFSVSTNFTSIYEDNTEKEDDHLYNFNIVLTHARADLWRTELFGHYVWWQARDSNNGQYDDFIWDLSLSKKTILKSAPAKFFFNVHNIFNSSQYWWDLIENQGRWVEAGFALSF